MGHLDRKTALGLPWLGRPSSLRKFLQPICWEGGNTPREQTHHPLPGFCPHQEHSSGFAKQTNGFPSRQPA